MKVVFFLNYFDMFFSSSKIDNITVDPDPNKTKFWIRIQIQFI